MDSATVVVLIACIIAGFMIQYFIIKNAVGAALTEHRKAQAKERQAGVGGDA